MDAAGAPSGKQGAVSPPPSKVVVFLHSGTTIASTRALSIAAAAVAIGRRAEVYLFWWALERFLQDRLDEPDFQPAARGRGGSLRDARHAHPARPARAPARVRAVHGARLHGLAGGARGRAGGGQAGDRRLGGLERPSSSGPLASTTASTSKRRAGRALTRPLACLRSWSSRRERNARPWPPAVLSTRPLARRAPLRGSGWHRLGNALKTTVLLAGLTALVLLIGQQLGGPRGLVIAGFFVVVMNFVSYWFSDRIALAMHGAQPLPREQAPWLHEMVERLAAARGHAQAEDLPHAHPRAQRVRHRAAARATPRSR